MSVKNGPARIAFTLTFGPKARAKPTVIASSPAFAAAYGMTSGVVPADVARAAVRAPDVRAPELVGDGVTGFLLAAGDHGVGAEAGDRERHLAAERPPAAGDEGHPPAQVEEVHRPRPSA